MPDKILLNIGGTRFHATRATLQRGTYFSTLLDRESKTHFESDGSIFIDRDGTHFRHILNFFRDGRVPDLPEPHRSELRAEAGYYRVGELVAGLSRPSKEQEAAIAAAEADKAAVVAAAVEAAERAAETIAAEKLAVEKAAFEAKLEALARASEEKLAMAEATVAAAKADHKDMEARVAQDAPCDPKCGHSLQAATGRCAIGGGGGLGSCLITFGAFGAPLLLVVSLILCLVRSRRQRSCKCATYRAAHGHAPTQSAYFLIKETTKDAPEPPDLHKHPIWLQYGKEGFKDGDAMDTSIVPEGNRVSTYVITQLGRADRHGERVIRGPSLRVAPPTTKPAAPPAPPAPADHPNSSSKAATATIGPPSSVGKRPVCLAPLEVASPSSSRSSSPLSVLATPSAAERAGGEATANRVFPDTKHRGRTFEEVRTTDPSYVRWAMSVREPFGTIAALVTYCEAKEAADTVTTERSSDEVDRVMEGRPYSQEAAFAVLNQQLLGDMSAFPSAFHLQAATVSLDGHTPLLTPVLLSLAQTNASGVALASPDKENAGLHTPSISSPTCHRRSSSRLPCGGPRRHKSCGCLPPHVLEPSRSLSSPLLSQQRSQRLLGVRSPR